MTTHDEMGGDTILLLERRLDAHERFLRRLLNPEDLGLAVTAEVRDEARILLGRPPVETPAAKIDAALAASRPKGDDESWRTTHGLLPGGVNPGWQPEVKEWS